MVMPHQRKEGFSGDGTRGEGRRGKRMVPWTYGRRRRKEAANPDAWEPSVSMAIQHPIVLWIREELPLQVRW